MRLRTAPMVPWYLLRERCTLTPIDRLPEPMAMENGQSVADYDEAGKLVNLPGYKVCALEMSYLAPEGGTILELGCGPASYGIHLARERPDLTILGLDLSEAMLARGRGAIKREGLTDRMVLRHGDMRDFASLVQTDVDVIGSVWALHHLPSVEAMGRCFQQICEVRDQTGCAVWLFDYARFRNPKTHPAFLSTLSDMEMPEALYHDSITSASAAFTLDEFRHALEKAGLEDLRHAHTRIWRNFQAHWAKRRDDTPSGHNTWWADVPLPPGRSQDAALLRKVFSGLPSEAM